MIAASAAKAKEQSFDPVLAISVFRLVEHILILVYKDERKVNP